MFTSSHYFFSSLFAGSRDKIFTGGFLISDAVSAALTRSLNILVLLVSRFLALVNHEFLFQETHCSML